MTVRVVPWTRSAAAGAVVSGVLLAAAFLPLPPLAALLVFVALVPLWRSLERAQGPSEGATVGAWFGCTFWAVQLAWVPAVGLRIDAAWPWMAWVGQVVLLSLLCAAMGAGFVRLRQRRIPLVAAAVLAWVGVEWARGVLLGPLSFPWSGVALPLARWPVLAQPAAWGGETLLAAGVVAVNAVAVAGSPLPGGGSGPASIRRGVVPLGLVVLWAALGAGRLSVLENRAQDRAWTVVIQPAVPLEVKRGPDAEEAALASLRSGLAAAGELLRAGEEALVVFPETHLPFAVRLGPDRGAGGGGAGDWPPPLPGEVGTEIQAWASAHDADVLVGGYRRGPGGLRNALLHFGAGGLRGSHDKVALVPGVEWGPGGLVPGANPWPLDVQGRPGVLICIESAWASLGRRQVGAGAGWLLNVTNDAWLGEGPKGEGITTPAFHQHPWHLVLRSVETGRGAIRVANNGWTGSVDPLGRWVAALPPHRPGVARIGVQALDGDTVFARVGDGLGPLCLLLLLFLPLGPRSKVPVDRQRDVE